MMSFFRWNDQQIDVSASVLGVGSLVALGSAAVSIFSVMCDPHIIVAGAPPFGTPAICGIPVKLLPMIAVVGVMLVVVARLPRLWSLLVKFRLVISIGALIAAVVLPAFHYPHDVLGACVS